jgi:hypothetical protein
MIFLESVHHPASLCFLASARARQPAVRVMKSREVGDATIQPALAQGLMPHDFRVDDKAFAKAALDYLYRRLIVKKGEAGGDGGPECALRVLAYLL